MATSTNPYAPPRAAVRDITDPFVRNEPADRGTRLAAALLDSVIFTVMVYLPMIGAVVAAAAAEGAAGTGGEDGTAAIILAVVALVALSGFGIWLWLTLKYMGRNGQSIAKKMLGIKVVRTDGSPASLGRLFWMRNALNFVLNMVPAYGLVDSLFIFGESRKCIHDMIADTIVVKA
jgi:uncharacterized RDD family membrane protein YckC